MTSLQYSPLNSKNYVRLPEINEKFSKLNRPLPLLLGYCQFLLASYICPNYFETSQLYLGGLCITLGKSLMGQCEFAHLRLILFVINWVLRDRKHPVHVCDHLSSWAQEGRGSCTIYTNKYLSTSDFMEARIGYQSACFAWKRLFVKKTIPKETW